MPSPIYKQELHFAKSFQELRKKSEIQKFGSTDIVRLVKFAKQFYDKVQENLSKGDDEVAYLFCFRFMTLCGYVTEDNQQRFSSEVGKKCIEMIELLETLTKRLQQRYEERQKNYEDRKAQIFNNSSSNKLSSSPVPGTSVKIETSLNVTDDDENDDYQTIDAKQLVERIQSLSEINKILIVDIRSSEEFNNSSIAANKLHATGEVNIINISNQSIVPALTIPILLKNVVSFGLTLDALERRRSMDCVVIMDEKTCHFDSSSKTVILANAFWKWDPSPDRIKSKPLLLKGGYFEFVLTYPIYSTKSDIINYAQINHSPINKRHNNNFTNKLLFNFDENGEEIKLTNPIENDDDNSSVDDDIDIEHEIEDIETESTTLFINKNINKSGGGGGTGSALIGGVPKVSNLNGFIHNNNNDAFSGLRTINRFASNTTNSTINNNTNNNSNNINNSLSIGVNSAKVPGVAMPVIPDRSSKPKIDTVFSMNKFDSFATIRSTKDIEMEDNSVDNDISNMSHKQSNNISISTPKPIIGVLGGNSKFTTNTLLENLPPKPAHLISSLNNNNSYTSETKDGRNGVDSIGLDGEEKTTMDVEDDFVAGNFDDLVPNGRPATLNSSSTVSRVLQTPVHHRKNGIFSFDDKMSENDDDDDEENDDGNPVMITSVVSKPITVKRPSNSTSGNYHDGMFSKGFSGSSNLSRSLSSPNIAQFDQESQESYHSVGSGTPKFSQQIPMVDRSMKPLPYQQVLRNARDFSPQFSSCGRITGLRNLGNTCFMNAILQCLNNTTPLCEFLRGGNFVINPSSKFGSNGELTVELIELFKQMIYPSNYKHISPKDFKNAVSRHIPDFIDYKQQDAHEFLVRFLDRVHADLNQNCANSYPDPVVKDPNYYDQLPITVAANSFWNLHMKRNKSIISDLFEGLIVSTLTCLHCNYTSKALEAFTCLTVPVPESGRTSLKNSLALFLRRERITDETAWHCPTCRQKRDAEKCTYIWRLPKVLVIHFKRFSYDGMWRQKICTFVDFSIENLILEARDGEEKRNYSLYGVVNHSGSLEGGHYIAFSRNLELNIGWHRYDDQDVSPVSASDVITQNAYVLFYKATN